MKDDIENLRFIVFNLSTNWPTRLSDGKRVDVHGGAIFINQREAKQYAVRGIQDNEFNRFVIGCFVFDKNEPQVSIDMIETFGFKGDLSNVQQMDLFKNL